MKSNNSKIIGSVLNPESLNLIPKAFTMVELLIVLSIFFAVVSSGVGAYFRFYNTAFINADVDHALTHIKQARFRSLKNTNQSDYGIRIDDINHRLIAFRGTYSPSDPDNLVFNLEKLEITDLSLLPGIGVTNEILFENPNGKTQNTGSFTISNGSDSFTFNISANGIVD